MLYLASPRLYLTSLFRELAFQISEQFAVLGSALNLRTAVVVGGMDMMAQAIELGHRPHVVVATPGRIVDLLKNCSGDWDLSRIKFLVGHGGSIAPFNPHLSRYRYWMRRTDCSLLHSHQSCRISLRYSRRSDRHASSQLP